MALAMAKNGWQKAELVKPDSGGMSKTISA